MKPAPTGYEKLPRDQARIVDEACDRFERAWQQGTPPAIETFLGSVAPAIRPVLLRELILVEVPYRRRAGETVSPEEYQKRFPELEAAWLMQVLPPGTQTNLARPRHEQPAPLTMPGYDVIEEIGRGGMGIVYKARDTQLGRLVALKILPPDAARDPERLLRFRREAIAVSALNHPAICTLYEFKEWRGQPYLVLEWIEGQTLRAIARTQPSLNTMFPIVAQVAQALAAAHAAGIVHRDIKPENIMVRSDGLVKVLDFGLARLMGEGGGGPQLPGRDTVPGTIMGTLNYMSPEQTRGEAAGTASDVFSLGAVLYELATGRTPFGRVTIAATLRAIEEEEPPTPTRNNPQLSPHVADLILRMLAKNARQRPNAEGVARFLRDVPLADTQIQPARTNPSAATFSASTLASGTDIDTSVRRIESSFSPRRAMLLVTVLFLAIGAIVTWIALNTGSKSDGQEANKSDDDARARLNAVIARLQALNPAYDGERRFRIEDGAVVELSICSNHLTDISPLEDLRDLKVLRLERTPTAAWRMSKLTDLSPLRHLRLTSLAVQNTNVRSLAACEDMPLEELDVADSAVQSLAPVAHRKLTRLNIFGTEITDLGAIRNMPLREASLGVSSLKDLSILKNSDLTVLSLQGAERLSDLKLLSRMKNLTRLSLNSTAVVDLDPLRGLPLATLDLAQCSSLKDLSPLAGMKTLKVLDVSRCPIADFTPLLATGIEELNGVANPIAHRRVLERIPHLRVINSQSIGHVFPRAAP